MHIFFADAAVVTVEERDDAEGLLVVTDKGFLVIRFKRSKRHSADMACGEFRFRCGVLHAYKYSTCCGEAEKSWSIRS